MADPKSSLDDNAQRGRLSAAMHRVTDTLGAIALLLLLFLFVLVVVGAILLILGITPSVVSSDAWKAVAGLWRSVWAWLSSATGLWVLVVLAFIGVFPVIYLAYQTQRRPVKIKRLSDDFLLLGLIRRGEEETVAQQHDRVYSWHQYLLFNALIVLVSILVLVAYAPLSPLAPGARSSVQPAALPTLEEAGRAASPQLAGAGPTAEARIAPQGNVQLEPDAFFAEPKTTVGPTSILASTNSITFTARLTTTAVMTPSQPITMTGNVVAVLPAMAAPSIPANADVIRLVFFAYLGAYVYSLLELVRRYNTFDLQPQVYAGILTRMVVAMALVLVGALAIFNAPATYQAAAAAPGYATIWLPGVIAFVIGAFPARGLEWLRRLADPVLSGRQVSLPNALPLESLLGISTWHASRLEQIGIDNAQNLAGADLREILLTTQFDAQVVVHWVDQAILYTKVGSDIELFRKHGFVTFTSFRLAVEALHRADPKPPNPAGDRLALQLGRTDFNDLLLLADVANFSNYHHLAQYYARTKAVAQRHAEDAQEVIIGRVEQLKVQEAIEYGEWYLKLNPTPDSSFLCVLGKAYYQRALEHLRHKRCDEAKADFDLALAQFNKALARDPNAAAAYLGRSLCFLDRPTPLTKSQSGDWEQAVRDTSQAIHHKKDFAEAYYVRGVAHTRLGQLSRAQDDLDRAICINDRYAEARYQRGVVLNLQARASSSAAETLKNAQEAIADLERAYWIGFNDEGALRLQKGMAYIVLGQYDLAIDELTRSIALLDEERAAEAHLQRAVAYRGKGPHHHADAKSDLQWILDRNPDLTTPVAKQAYIYSRRWA